MPRQFVTEGFIRLNISASATQSFRIDADAVEFNARFSGLGHHVHVPLAHVLAIVARENGKGMAFTAEQDAAPAGEPQQPIDAGDFRQRRTATGTAHHPGAAAPAAEPQGGEVRPAHSVPAGFEGMADPLDAIAGRAFGCEIQHVEAQCAARQRGMVRQQVAGGALQCDAACASRRWPRRRRSCAGAQPHFRNHDYPVDCFGDDIDLACSTTIVAEENGQLSGLKETCGRASSADRPISWRSMGPPRPWRLTWKPDRMAVPGRLSAHPSSCCVRCGLRE